MFHNQIPAKSVKTVFPVAATDWDEIYALDPLAMPSQSRIWSNTILKGTGCRNVSRRYLFDDGQEAILPLFSKTIVPLAVSVLHSPPPAWGFGGVLSSAPLKSRHLKAILEDCAGLPGGAFSIRPNPLQALEWIRAITGAGWSMVPRVAHVLSLEGGFETVWTTRISGKTRNRIRRAERQGVTVEMGNSEALIASFEFVFRRSVDRWARKQNEFAWLARLRAHVRDSSRKFRAMAEQAGRLFLVGIASHDGRPVAGSILLLDRNAHYTRGAMDDRFIGKTYANYLLQAKMIERACDQNCNYYHMGESGKSGSIAEFKEHFGAVSTPYVEARYERLPIFSADRLMRSGVKRLIGFSDV